MTLEPVERVVRLMRMSALRHRRDRLPATLPRQALQSPDRARFRDRLPTRPRPRTSRPPQRLQRGRIHDRAGAHRGRLGSVGGGNFIVPSTRTYMAVCDSGRCGRAPSPTAEYAPPTPAYRNRGEELMADRGDSGGTAAGISLGGIIVIVGIVPMFVWSFLGGLDRGAGWIDRVRGLRPR